MRKTLFQQLTHIKRSQLEQGQTLITLLVFMVIGITIVSSAALVLAANMLSTTTTEQGQMAYYVAESGAEDGMLHMLRNPLYDDTYSPLPSTDGQATIKIHSGTITSVGKSGNTVRKVQVQTTYTGGVLTVTSWKEIQ